MHYSDIQLIFALFVLVALGGLTMLGMLLSGRSIPGFMGIGHGVAGIIGVVLLWIVFGSSHAGLLPAIVLTLAMLGGLFFFQIMSRQKRPVSFVVMHGAIGLVGLYLLYRIV